MFKRVRVETLVVAVALVAVLALAACGGGGASVADGKTLLEERCVQCHGIETVTSAQKTAAEWEATVDNMIAKGAEVSDEEKPVLVEYLAETYGP